MSAVDYADRGEIHLPICDCDPCLAREVSISGDEDLSAKFWADLAAPCRRPAAPGSFTDVVRKLVRP